MNKASDETVFGLIGLVMFAVVGSYTVLWLFPLGRFRYIFCYPGYTWMTASGTWHSAKGVIHCRGTSSSFTDNFIDNHSNRSYTAIFRQNDDGHSLAPVGRSTGLLTRLDLNEPAKQTLLLEEQLVPTQPKVTRSNSNAKGHHLHR
ncbi:MAG: hypothetical protein ABI955_10125, partial [Nitrospirota bacterium]